MISPDGRYRLVVETDPRIDERLLPRLRLEEVTTGEVLFDLHSTRLVKQPEFRGADNLWLEVEHAGQPARVLVHLATRTCQCEPHDYGRPLTELALYLSELNLRPPVYATRGQIVRSLLWLIVTLGFTAVFFYVALRVPVKPRDWWKVLLGAALGCLFTWVGIAELRDLLRRPRRK